MSFHLVEWARSFLKTQMTMKIVKHRLVSIEISLTLARETFPIPNQDLKAYLQCFYYNSFGSRLMICRLYNERVW